MLQSPGVRHGILSLVVALAPALAKAQSVAIEHDALECWPSDQYPILTAKVAPPGQVRTAKIYFRAEEFPDFYFVEAAIGPDGRAEAVLPLAAPETERVVYYIEAVGLDFETSRTSEWMPPVSDSEDCRRRDPMLALFQGDPTIVVGSVRAGAPLLPLGFQTAGIVGAGTGGGIGAVAIGSIVAGGAAGGVLIVTAGGDAPETTTSIVAGTPSTTVSSAPTTTVPAATTTISSSGPTTTTIGITTTTSASPPTTTIPGPTTTTTAGATTTTTTAASTTSTTGPSTTTTTPSTTTTTTPSTTTTTSAPSTTTTTTPPGADVTISIAAPATVRFGTLLTYSVRVSNNGPSTATGVRATLSFPFLLTLQSSGFCTGGLGTFQCDFGTLAPGGSATVNILLIVLQLGTITASGSVSANQPDPVPGNNNASATTNVTLFLREKEEALVSVTTHLDVPPGDGRDRGEIVLGSQHYGIDSASPVELHAQGQAGENAIEAVLSAASGRAGTWRFDFRGSRAMEGSSIAVEAGEVAALEPRAVVFRLRGEAGERIRFRFRARER